jgi:hypothetical protein
LPTKFARNEQIYCEQKFAHGELILLTENLELPFILLSIFVWTHDTISIFTRIAQIEENLLTVKKNCSQKSNLLRARICSQQKFAHRICLQHRKTAHEKNLAG